MDALNKCPTCASQNIAIERGRHHFKESGLNNVHLLNVEIMSCNECGERIVFIPHSNDLMKSVAEECILLKPGRLNSAEVKFLRKNLGLKIADFAQRLGVTRATVSRWENEQTVIDSANDRLIRLIYATEKRVNNSVLDKLREHLKKEETDSELDYVFPVPSDPLEQFSCAAAVN